MKLLHLTLSMQLGGIETMLINIVNEQAKKHQVALMFLNDDFNVDLLNKVNNNVNVVNIGRKLHSKNLFDIIKLNYKIWSHSYDIIHIHHPSLIRLLLTPVIRGRIVFTMHDVPRKEDFRFLPKYENICAISKSVQEALKEHGYESRLIENGININLFEKKQSYRKSVFRIVQVGRLIKEKKGQDIAISAVKKFVDAGKKDIHLDIIGEGPDMCVLKKMIDDYEISNFVSLLGARSQNWLQHHYKDYSLFIQPSRFEGFGLTVAEAMAAGVPVLVSNQEGPMEIIAGGKFGFSFKVGDINDCYNQIMKIMNMDNLSNIADKAHIHVCSNYSVNRTAHQYLDYYKMLL